MKIRYDPEVDAAYISFRGKRVQVTTVRLTEDIAIDFGPGERLVGIEILDASKYFQSGRKKRIVELENLRAVA